LNLFDESSSLLHQKFLNGVHKVIVLDSEEITPIHHPHKQKKVICAKIETYPLNNSSCFPELDTDLKQFSCTALYLGV